jgi:tetratricopeptide (TPR) repeat protein
MTRAVLIAVLWSVVATLTSADHLFLRASGNLAQAKLTPGSEEPRPAQTLLVFPFENSSRLAKLDWLGEGLAELTIERLAVEGHIVFPREERLATLEKLGLPASTRFSRATMLKIAEEIDADYVIFGQYTSDGRTLTVTAQVLRIDPPRLLSPVEESGALEDLMDTHARLAWRLSRVVEPAYPLSQHDFAQKLFRLRLDAFEYYVRGLLSLEDEQRLRDFREAARLEPAWDNPAFALGQTYFGRRDCESALPWLSRVPPTHERGLEASFDAGVCHLLRNDPARAEAAFASLLERIQPSPGGARELPEGLNNLALARERLGKSREAAAELEHATQLDPEEVDYWFNLGLVRLRTNEPAAAVAPFREALRRKPEDAEARALLIAALERSGQATTAAAERAELTHLGERFAVLPAVSSEALARLDRIKFHVDTASLRQFPENLGQSAAEPGSPLGHRRQHHQLHLTRARQFLAAGKLIDAQREFIEAIVLAPLDPAARQGLAEVYQRQGRPDDAIREMRAALAAHDDAAGHTALARLYLGQKRMAEAREELRLALKLDPGYGEARQLLDQLQPRTGSGQP